MRFDLDMPAWKWPFYVARHPFEGYEDLKWKKAYNIPTALIIIAVFFAVSVCDTLLTGFLHNERLEKTFNVMPIIIQSIVMFFTWVLANWSLCTLLGGEGTMTSITVNTAYALVPYIIGKAVNIPLSNWLTNEENIFLTLVSIVSVTWSVLLLFSGMKTAHRYTFWQTIGSMVLTVIAMLIILILAVLLVSLFQQFYLFANSIYTELLYRFPNLTSTQLLLIFIGAAAVITVVIIMINIISDKIRFKRERKKLDAPKNKEAR